MLGTPQRIVYGRNINEPDETWSYPFGHVDFRWGKVVAAEIAR